MESIGDKIKKLRKERHVSQEALAYGVGVTANTVSRWEKNAISPTATNLEALIKFFGVSADYFIGGEKDAPEAAKPAVTSAADEAEAVKPGQTEEKIPEPDTKTAEQKIPLYLKITLIAGCALFFGGGAALMYCIFGYNLLPESLQGSSLTFKNNIITVSMPLPTLIILIFLLLVIFAGLGLGIYSLVTLHRLKK